MNRTRLISCIVILACLDAPAAASDTMTFKNNLLPGHMTIHSVTRRTRRVAKRKDHKETLNYEQTARWVQYNVNEPRPGSTRCYQMIVDEPAEVVSLFRGKEKIKPRPLPEAFNLNKGSARLHSLTRSPRDAGVLLPKCADIDRVILQVLLDFAHWPSGKVPAGHRWERDVDTPEFKGTQTYEFIDLVRIKDAVCARVTLYVEGEFQSELGKQYEFKKGQAIIHWLRLDRTLLKVEARAEFERRRPGKNEAYETQLDVALKTLRSHDADEQETIIDQLIAFDQAFTKQRLGELDEARSICKQIRKVWPDSVWLPVVAEIERQVSRTQAPEPRLKTSQVKKMLANSLIRWEAARTNRQYDLMDQTREALQHLAANYRDKIRKLAKSKKSEVRAPAIFGLAFSQHPSDFFIVQKSTRDNSSRVRGMALAGLAARADPETSADMLMLLLGDKKATVRSRACQAIAACLTREHYSVAVAAEKVAALVKDDKNSAVRIEAVRALAEIGAPADIPKLEAALADEKKKDVRSAIKKAIKRLKKL